MSDVVSIFRSNTDVWLKVSTFLKKTAVSGFMKRVITMYMKHININKAK